MRNRVLTSMAALVLAIVPAAGQAPKASTAAAVKGTWTPPRTPDGQPDLQGVWSNNSVTPLQRPKELAGKEYYTDRKSTRLNSSHIQKSRMPSSA